MRLLLKNDIFWIIITVIITVIKSQKTQAKEPKTSMFDKMDFKNRMTTYFEFFSPFKKENSSYFKKHMIF